MDAFKRACPPNGPGGWNCPHGCCGPAVSKKKDRRAARRKLRRELREALKPYDCGDGWTDWDVLAKEEF